ncbi:MAG: hypothetical protein LBF97_04375, partial [Elusimicrobiota bacterium]|nr:hypothetical protein [Elusimicrobiota bacterium]
YQPSPKAKSFGKWKAKLKKGFKMKAIDKIVRKVLNENTELQKQIQSNFYSSAEDKKNFL